MCRINDAALGFYNLLFKHILISEHIHNKLAKNMGNSPRCQRCSNPGTRVILDKDGKERRLCPQCYVAVCLSMAVQNRMIEERLLKKHSQYIMMLKLQKILV